MKSDPYKFYNTCSVHHSCKSHYNQQMNINQLKPHKTCKLRTLGMFHIPCIEMH